jgi:hypothetical protein
MLPIAIIVSLKATSRWRGTHQWDTRRRSQCVERIDDKL